MRYWFAVDILAKALAAVVALENGPELGACRRLECTSIEPAHKQLNPSIAEMRRGVGREVALATTPVVHCHHYPPPISRDAPEVTQRILQRCVGPGPTADAPKLVQCRPEHRGRSAVGQANKLDNTTGCAAPRGTPSATAVNTRVRVHADRERARIAGDVADMAISCCGRGVTAVGAGAAETPLWRPQLARVAVECMVARRLGRQIRPEYGHGHPRPAGVAGPERQLRCHAVGQRSGPVENRSAGGRVRAIDQEHHVRVPRSAGRRRRVAWN